MGVCNIKIKLLNIKTIFSRWEGKSVSIEYPQQQKFSFKLEKKDGKYSVNPLNPTATRMQGQPQQGMVKRYLGHFKHLEAEAIKNSYDRKLEITKDSRLKKIRNEKN